jgi:N-acetylmuramoyl-L-alanine amidase
MLGVMMSKFHGLVLTFLALLLYALPAQAGKLVYWRFESAQNRLVFTTDDRVQPTAQLIPNPTRVVVDLPGITLGRSTVNQPIGGVVRNIRVAQFDAFTTRLVIELAPGYTVDPQQVKVRGITPTQWTVELPTPQRLPESTSPPAYPQPPTSNPNPWPRPQSTAPSYPANPRSQSSSYNPATNSSGNNDYVQLTQNGIFVRLDRNGSNSGITTNRSEDGQTISFILQGATFPKPLAGQTFAMNQYGVSDIQFIVSSENSPQINLTINRDSPPWQAYYSRLGGIVLLPRGGMKAAQDFSPPPSTGIPLSSLSSLNPNPLPTISNPNIATISGLELTRDNRQLIIRADRPIQARGSLNRLSGDYEIRVDNARLMDNLQGPQLGRTSPIYQLRIRQEGTNSVAILVQPSIGTRFGRIIQGRDGRVALEISPRGGGGSRPLYGGGTQVYNPSSGNTPIPINVPPNNSFPLPSNNFPPPSNNYPRPNRGSRLVFIDPGHGGKDPGAIGLNGIQEKDIILPISQHVANYLEQQGIRVMLARTSDYFVSLQGRTDMANRANANLFVSIHANSMGASRPDISGLEVYYFGDRGLADTIHRSILRSVSVPDRGVRRARFYVLRHSKMPSTLVEVGFVTGYDDAAKLINPTYQQQIAQAIARGIVEYMQQN